MNKLRNNQRRLTIPEMTFLVLAALVLMTAGVAHAWLKNSHVEVIRDVDKTERRISDHEDSINSLQVKIDKKLNIYQIRDDLNRAGSELCEVPVSSVEKINTHNLSKSKKIAADTSAVAQTQP